MKRSSDSKLARARAAIFALLAASAAVFVADTAAAQACDTSCPIRMRDARGCCPSSAPTPPPPPSVAPPTPKRPGTPEKTPPPKPGKTCPPGQEITPDTAGNCCWPGQAWSGSACVGMPTVCPNGMRVVPERQACELETCGGGRIRANDGVHCCWPGQAWTASRDQCVGIPECPTGMEVEGESCRSDDLDRDGIPNKLDKCPNEPEDKDGFQDEDGCPDPDNDADGILDANDQCPLQPEDKNGFKDEDGCPDEPERAAIVAAQERVAAAKAAEAKAKQEEDARRQAAAEAAAKRAEEEESRSSRRTTGLALAITGLAFGAGSGACFLVSDSASSAIETGGLATSSDIESKSSLGETMNIVGITTGVIGVVLVGVGAPLWLANLSSSEPKSGLVRDGFIVRF